MVTVAEKRANDRAATIRGRGGRGPSRRRTPPGRARSAAFGPYKGPCDGADSANRVDRAAAGECAELPLLAELGLRAVGRARAARGHPARLASARVRPVGGVDVGA